ncbi:MAG: penicillin-binding transpeptidase domain-containing protein [Candidatus Melainabacteria bacterium]|nr:penicillin-binding transpeptidase domain-containing protein [Candidatus Melainabacteria bacterium]
MTDETKPREEIENPERRRFLKSIFGLGSAFEVAQGEPAEAAGPSEKSVPSGGIFFWGDLKNGNVGFPSGLKVPHTRPGSVMKLVTAACLLEEGLLNPNETSECRGTIVIDSESYHCGEPHGDINIEQAIAKSCNVFFARATRKTGPAAIIEYAQKFGFDRAVAGFECGAFPTKPKYSTVLYALGLADDLQPNALQLLRLAAIFATEGDVPPLKNAGMFDTNDLSVKPFALKLKDSTFRHIRAGMVMACQNGTAEKLDPHHKLKIAAKTGTVARGRKFESWVTGYFPHDNPKHAFCLYAPVGTSHDSAIPQAREQLLSVEWPGSQ